MNLIRMAIAVVMTASLTSAAVAADNKKLIVGTWEVTKADPGTIPVGSTVAFTADGKIKVTVMKDVAEGTYKLDGDSFTFEIKIGDQVDKQKIKINKLDEKEFDTNDKDGKKVVLKRVK